MNITKAKQKTKSKTQNSKLQILGSDSYADYAEKEIT